MRRSRVSLGTISTANVLNCFRNDRLSSKFIGEVISSLRRILQNTCFNLRRRLSMRRRLSNFQKIRCVSRENQS